MNYETSGLHRNGSISTVAGSGLRRAASTKLGDRRTSANILEEKLPSIMRHPILPVHATRVLQPEEMEEEALKQALQKRLDLKNLAIASVAEFVGTFFFLFFALATATRASDALPHSLQAQLYSSLGFGFGLCISAWVFFRISGGVQNPAIALALTLTGALNWLQCIALTFAQFLGGIVAAGLVSGLLPGKVNARTTLGPNTTITQGFFLEFFLTCLLIFAVLMLAAEKHKATFLAPVGIGLTLFITQLLGQSYTGASVNPARTLGPDAVTNQFSTYCWIYYVAPYCAAIVTSGFYLTLKWLRYETTTPDQDGDEQTAGLRRQIIIDGNGALVGTIDTVNASDYSAIIAETSKPADRHVTETRVYTDPGFAGLHTVPEQPAPPRSSDMHYALTGESLRSNHF